MSLIYQLFSLAFGIFILFLFLVVVYYMLKFGSWLGDRCDEKGYREYMEKRNVSPNIELQEIITEEV